jgi:hypothetical protein
MSEGGITCPQGLRLQFRYTHNSQNQDLLFEQVGSIRVFLFDQNTGTLAYIIPVGTQDIAKGYIDANVAQGLYTAIAWGGSSTNMLQGGYTDAQATNPATAGAVLQTVPIAIGSTTFDNFRMMLSYDLLPAGSNTLADVAPKVSDFDDLFYASTEDIFVVSNKQQTVDLSFIKNTSTLKITVTGLQHLRSAMPLNVFTTGKNWLYEYDNTPDTYTPRMLYLPQSETLAANNTMEVSIKQQRIHISQSAIDQIMLYVQDPATGTDIIAPLNVTAAIMQNPAYQSQAAIDAEDLFTINLAITAPDDSYDLTVTITINDWEIVILNPIPM